MDVRDDGMPVNPLFGSGAPKPTRVAVTIAEQEAAPIAVADEALQRRATLPTAHMDAATTIATLGGTFTPPPLPFDEEKVAQFWHFFAERHLVWHRRVELRLPRPWTDDPTLQNARFTNMFRALDRGTQFVVAEVMELPEPLERRVFRQLVYRFFNLISTYQSFDEAKLFQLSDPVNVEKIARDVLNKRRTRGEKVYTGAYIATYCPDLGAGSGEGNAARVVRTIAEWAPTLASHLKAGDPKKYCAMVKQLPGFGDFLSWQATADWTHPTLRDGQDVHFGQGGVLRIGEPMLSAHWAVPGPGAYKGLALMGVTRKSDAIRAMDMLAITSDKGLHGRNWVPLIDLRTGAEVGITAVDVEHALCEWQKYMRIAEGGSAKGKFAGPPATAREWEPSGRSLPAWDPAGTWDGIDL